MKIFIDIDFVLVYYLFHTYYEIRKKNLRRWVQTVTLPINASKITNIKKILIELLSDGEKTKLDIVLSTGLSNSTVSDSINRLVKLNLVAASGEGESDGGRRPLIYTLNRKYGKFLGIAQNEDGFCFAVTNMYNDVVKYERYKFDNSKHILDFYRIIHKVLNEFGKDDIISIGIGLNDVVNSEKGIVLSNKALDWENVHLKELLERRFLVPVYIDHLMNNVVQHEKLKGHAMDTDSFLCIFSEFSEKIGIYINGAVYRGSHFIAGKRSDVSTLTHDLKLIQEFLDIEKVLCFYSSPDFNGLSVSNTDEKGGGKPPVFIKSGQEIFAKSAALAAEYKWFESSSILTSGSWIE